MRLKNLLHPEIWIAVAVLLALSIPFAVSDLDLWCAAVFFRQGWLWGSCQPWRFLYHLGTLPGLLLSGAGLFVIIGAWLWPQLKTYRRFAAVIVLTLLLGPGLLINALGKEYWGRPRPRDVSRFGGTQAFHRFYQPGLPGRGKSFPCGHASVGFLFVSLYFIAGTRRWKWSWLGFGLAYGTLMGIGRMAQGAHFASDVIWSGGLTYFSAALSHHVLLPPAKTQASADLPLPGRRPAAVFLGWTLMGSTLGLLTFLFLLATPYSKTWSGKAAPAGAVGAVRLHLPGLREAVHIQRAAQETPLQIQAELHGFGFPKLDVLGALTCQYSGNTLSASLTLDFNRITTERQGVVRVCVQPDLHLMLYCDNADGDIRLQEDKPAGSLGPLVVRSRQGSIWFQPQAETTILGPVTLTSRDGDIHLVLPGLRRPGKQKWEVGSEKGRVGIDVLQLQPPLEQLQLWGWSHSGEITFNGKMSGSAGLYLRWDGGQGRAEIKSDGPWHRKGNMVYSPPGTATPALAVDLATQTGHIRMHIAQQTGFPD
ncbi:phosphatase PAP2 family protein [candidate division FCPU426 bacterium]|nr:phosphatase PAP2 family protein [candidate division FCPU426 bacterium]